MPEPVVDPPKPPEGGAPPPPPPADPPKPPVVVAAPPPGAGAARTLTDADDDVPAEGELFQLSRGALKSRLERYSRRQLRERFGTDDPDAIKVKLDRAAELERQEDERKRAAMSEQDRLKADLAAAELRNQETEARLREVTDQRTYDAAETRLSRIAERFIDPDYVDPELTAYAKHLRTAYSKEDLAKLSDADIEKYFKERVEKKPKLAKDFGVAPPKPPVAPLNNGVTTNDKPPPAPPPNGKKFAPGAGLTPQQARAEASKLGYRW
jgi:hypothetical protein